MSGGYVYVIEFGNGTVKVGHTQAITQRLRTHKQIARSFGLAVSRCWESPCHDGWRENEEALKRLARELGGTPTTPEYFNGVSFDVLVEKAAELPFPAPAAAPAPVSARVVAKASTPQAAGIDDHTIRRATLREHARQDSLKSWVAHFFIDRGTTPQVMRIVSSKVPDFPELAELADHMEHMLRVEAKVRRQLGAPPVPYRPFCGGELSA